MIGRRGFLGSLLGAVGAIKAGMELDLDKLLWVPGQKLISVPSVVVSTDIGFPDPVTLLWITQESMRLLKNNLKLARVINADYQGTYSQNKIGDLVRTALPVPVLLSEQAMISLSIPVEEMSNISRETFSQRHIEPSMAQMAALMQSKGFTDIVTADLTMPNNFDSTIRVSDRQLSMRGVQGHDFITDKNLIRLDVLYGGVGGKKINS